METTSNIILKVGAGILIVDGIYHIVTSDKSTTNRIIETGLGVGLALL